MAEKKTCAVMLGDSLTYGHNWQDNFPKLLIYNLGVSGDTTLDVAGRLSGVIALKPDKIFLQAGINNFYTHLGQESIFMGHLRIWDELARSLPNTELYILSLLPLDEKRFQLKNKQIMAVNRRLKEKAQQCGLIFIDLYQLFIDDNNNLAPEYTYDGLHLTALAYQRWITAITPYLNH